MNRTRRVAVATVCVWGSVLSAQRGAPPHAPQTAFRAAVELISLNVTVRNGTQQYVDDLGQEDFLVFENNVRQTVTFFARSNVPLGLAVLLDTSGSMDQTLPVAQDAAIAFTRTLRRADLAAILDFDSTVKVAQGFTNDVPSLETAIRAAAAGGSTALFNAVYIALKELSRLPAQDDSGTPRRRAIVVLSDGDDTSSLVDFDAVLDLASRSDTAIYTIGLGRRDAPIHADDSGEFILRRLAEQTGGRAFFPKEAKELSAVYTDIREELSRQYSLAYQSAGGPRDGQWRRIAVRVNRPNVTVRTRQGYFAPGK